MSRNRLWIKRSVIRIHPAVPALSRPNPIPKILWSVGFGRHPFTYAIPIFRPATASRFFMALSPISPSTDLILRWRDGELVAWSSKAELLRG
jgi:hypothetical protein